MRRDLRGNSDNMTCWPQGFLALDYTITPLRHNDDDDDEGNDEIWSSANVNARCSSSQCCTCAGASVITTEIVHIVQMPD